MDENYVYEQVAYLSNIACQRMNDFSTQILRTRGGRIGSGMGALLEALWGYMMNQIISQENSFPIISTTIFLVLDVTKYGMPLHAQVNIFVLKPKA